MSNKQIGLRDSVQKAQKMVQMNSGRREPLAFYWLRCLNLFVGWTPKTDDDPIANTKVKDDMRMMQRFVFSVGRESRGREEKMATETTGIRNTLCGITLFKIMCRELELLGHKIILVMIYKGRVKTKRMLSR